MARPYRLQAENCFYHITARGNNKQPIFDDDVDYEKLRSYVKKAKQKFRFYIYAYVLMPNHYHLLIETLLPNLSRIMQTINTSYTVYFNAKHKKVGHLFQGRYKSIVVDENEYFDQLTRYIHLNPVKANIVKTPEDYKWSSYGSYLNGRSESVTDINKVNEHLSMNMAEYKGFVQDGLVNDKDVFEETYAGFILGEKNFIEKKIGAIKTKVSGEDIAWRNELRGTKTIDEIVEQVAQKYGKSKEELFNGKKRSLIERKIAMYVLSRNTGFTQKEIGLKFGINSSSVSSSIRAVEKLIKGEKKIKKDLETINC